MISSVVGALILSEYSFVDSDKALQLAAAKSFKEGHGVSIPVIDPSNIDEVEYKQLTNWPPLYSVVTASISIFFNGDFYATSYAFDVLAIVINLLLLTLICRRLKLPPAVIAIVLLWKACAISDYVVRSSPTDMIALDALLFGVYMSVRYISSPRMVYLAGLTIAFTCAALLKYLYLPIPLGISLLFLWNWFRDKNKKFLIASLFLITVPALLFTLLFIYHFNETGQIIDAPKSLRGFYPENLSKVYPVFWESFVSVDFVTTQISQKTQIPYKLIYGALQITSSFLIVIVIGHHLITMIRHRLLFPGNSTKYFFLIASAISSIILIELLYLSLTNHMHLLPPVDVWWTYIMQPRYFLFLQYFFFVYVTWLVFKRLQKSTIRAILIIILLAMFAVEFIHGITTALKTTYEHTNSLNKKQWTELTSYINQIKQQAEKEGRELIVVSPDYGYIGYAALNNIKVIRDTDKLNSLAYQPKSKRLLLFIKQDGSKKGFENFLMGKNIDDSTRLHGTLFYKYSIQN